MLKRAFCLPQLEVLTDLGPEKKPLTPKSTKNVGRLGTPMTQVDQRVDSNRVKALKLVFQVINYGAIMISLGVEWHINLVS